MKIAWLLASSVVFSSSWLVTVPAAAQERIYRCGNEYTNRIGNRKDCKVVEGGNVTIVQGTAPAAAPPPPRTSTPPAASGGAPRVVSAPPSAPRVDSPEQRARDSDAKAILAQELRNTEARQAELVKEYNNGEPDKIGGEARNYQKYLDRVAEMKASIDRNQSDIDGLKRELGRLK